MTMAFGSANGKAVHDNWVSRPLRENDDLSSRAQCRPQPFVPRSKPDAGLFVPPVGDDTCGGAVDSRLALVALTSSSSEIAG